MTTGALMPAGTSSGASSVFTQQPSRTGTVRAVAAALVLLVPGGLTASMGQLPAVFPEDLTGSHSAGARLQTAPAESLADGADGQVAASAATLRALREQTSLNWSEIARMFGVSLRTVHNWKDGTRLPAVRERRLNQVAELLRQWDAPPSTFRGALRTTVQGHSLIDIIGDGSPVSLVQAHLAAMLGPAAVASGAPPAPRRRAASRPHDPRQVDARTMFDLTPPGGGDRSQTEAAGA